MIRRPPRSTLLASSAASDVYKRQGLLWCSIAAQCQLNGLAGHDITVESMGVKSQVMGFEVLKKLNYYQRFYLRKELEMLESWLPNWSHMVPQLIPEVESVLTEVFEALAMD